jgi:dolichol-phosphate mannosyltransferase
MSVAIVMPAWNEASGIGEFLNEIHESFSGVDHVFVVVDDASTDNTVEVLSELQTAGLPLQIKRNPRNMGHGPSTINALRAGQESGSKIVLALDGDGQFLGSDIRLCYDTIIASNAQIVEGVRTRSTDPLYRKITSFTTRFLVWSSCGRFPRDANTPLRVYQRKTLEELIVHLPEQSLTPNLMISSMTRVRKVHLESVEVSFIDRRGLNPQSTSWGRSKSFLPSKRFVTFCMKATKSWLSFNPRSR